MIKLCTHTHTVHAQVPEVGWAPEETLIVGTAALAPVPTVAGVPPTLPWPVGERGTMGRAGEESGVVYLGIPKRLNFLFTLRWGMFMRLRDPGVASSLAFLAMALPLALGYGWYRPAAPCLEAPAFNGNSRWLERRRWELRRDEIFHWNGVRFAWSHRTIHKANNMQVGTCTLALDWDRMDTHTDGYVQWLIYTISDGWSIHKNNIFSL